MSVMKARIIFSAVVAGLFLMTSCMDSQWKEHYYSSETDVSNEQVLIVDESSEDYLRAHQGRMYEFLNSNGVFETLKEKAQLHTLLVVEDADFVQPEEDAAYIANSHVTDICLSPSNLFDGERILMWHNKFVTVGMDSLARMGQIDHITFNGSPVSSVVKTKDGIIYVLSSMIETPVSLYDFINELPEEYSQFKQMILASGGQIFDKANSKPIGVDATGNTIYDTVWIYTNDFFDAKNFSLSSESLTATMLLFSNKVIDEAMHRADSCLSSWGLQRDPEILRRWILEVAFYKTRYTPEAFAAASDLSSIYNRQWRISEQQVDLENPIEVSNGIIYDVQHFRIPNNILIYRIKDYYRNYEYCTEEQKTAYYQMENLKSLEIKTEVADWTPESGVWPMHGSYSLSAYCDDASQGFFLGFSPIYCVYDGSGNVSDVKEYKIPPGTYRFAMGFMQNMNVTMAVKVYVKDGYNRVLIGQGTAAVGSTTEFHLDRGTFLSDTWPEGYKEVKDALTHSKKNNYDTDGGCVIESLEIPDLYGDGTALPIVITLECETGVSSRLAFHHWCLRPTSNNY